MAAYWTGLRQGLRTLRFRDQATRELSEVNTSLNGLALIGSARGDADSGHYLKHRSPHRPKRVEEHHLVVRPRPARLYAPDLQLNGRVPGHLHLRPLRRTCLEHGLDHQPFPIRRSISGSTASAVQQPSRSRRASRERRRGSNTRTCGAPAHSRCARVRCRGSRAPTVECRALEAPVALQLTAPLLLREIRIVLSMRSSVVRCRPGSKKTDK
jgi:hypothetical protein